jgi:hypothetical protein
VTPFLGLPGDAEDLTPPVYRSWRNLSPDALAERDDICEELKANDLAQCSYYARKHANKAGYSQSETYHVCERTAMKRYGECLAGGSENVRTPLFRGDAT